MPVHSRRLLERLWDEVERIDLTGSLAHRAGDLAEQYALRGYDAVHLASLEAIADADTLLVTFDRNLRRAARIASRCPATGSAPTTISKR